MTSTEPQLPPENWRWILRRRPTGALEPSDFELIANPLPPLVEGQVLVRNTHLSIDPSNRMWMADIEQFFSPVALGSVMRGFAIGVVAATRSDRYKVGDPVRPILGNWEQYSIWDERELRPLKPSGQWPTMLQLGVLGVPGFTAYVGLLEVCNAKAGETVVVSAAGGAVGSLVGQIAKIVGCRVVGIAGGAAKCRWITEDLGFDGAIDYKTEDVGESLRRVCPEGIDVDFENVGGPILDSVLGRMKPHGRIAICGLISGYDRDGPIQGPRDFRSVLVRSLTIRGFVIADYAARFHDAYAQLSDWMADGRLKWHCHVIDGLRSAPEALRAVLAGNHFGKVLVRL